MNLDRSELNPCVCRDSEQDVAGEEHGDDFFDPWRGQNERLST